MKPVGAGRNSEGLMETIRHDYSDINIREFSSLKYVDEARETSIVEKLNESSQSAVKKMEDLPEKEE